METNATFTAAELEAERQRLLAELLADEGFDAVDDAGITPRGHDDAPLAFAQELLWLVGRVNGGVAVGNIPELFTVRGALDVDALRAAVADLVARHGVLRTAFEERNGEAIQRVLPVAEVPWTQVDLRSMSPAERDAEAERLVHAEVVRPFDFAKAPLLRGTLIRTADDAWTLLLMQHHLVCDGLSREQLCAELGELFAARVRGVRAELPVPSIEYADFAEWQRARAAAGELAA